MGRRMDEAAVWWPVLALELVGVGLLWLGRRLWRT